MAKVHKMPGVLPQKQRISKTRKRSKLPVLILLTGIAILLYWTIFIGPAFAITSVEVAGTSDPSVKAIADKLVGDNIFRLRTASLQQEMRQAYPPLSEVTIVRGLPQTVRLDVRLRTPMLRWQTPEGIYILDSNGESFAVGESEAYAALPKVLDNSGVPVKVGQEIVSASFISFISELGTLTPTIFQRPIVNYEVKETTYHLDILLEGDVRVKVSIQRPAKEQLESAQTILAAHPEVHLIDVRIPGIGYYK